VAGRDADDPNQIGLGFEPVPGRTVPDIAGTLWMDVGTGELRSVEFDYVQSGAVYQAGSGGRIDFRVLESGPWVVEAWRLRMMVGMTRTETRFHESGGSLLEVLSGIATRPLDIPKEPWYPSSLPPLRGS
jgi:hypothetical protein